ncbi:MAG: hypothetical protein HQ581_22125 [Planctomycetes bacterium]|nr:hypothetical protein [Planctomycetota bacterium]
MHPEVIHVLDELSGELGWCDQLESAPADAIVGKVLCVCAGMGIARTVLAAELKDCLCKAAESLEVLSEWVDCPTDERFEHICALIFDEEQPLPDDLDPHGVVWWAIRVATSSVGNYEAGWALTSLCNAAMKVGFDNESLREIARRELLSRLDRE